MPVNLVLNHIRRVRHEDARIRVARAHLAERTLERWYELGVKEHRLGVLELDGDVAREAEVRVLVDRARDEARHGAVCAEYLREGVREGGRGLDGGEVHFADIRAGG